MRKFAPSSYASPAPARQRLRRLWLVATGLSVSLACVTLYFTLTPQPPGPRSDVPLDKLAHFAAHFAIVLPVCLIRPRAALWVVPLAMGFGALIEMIQPFFGRGREVGDMIANALGALAGAGAGKIMHRRFEAWIDAPGTGGSTTPD